MTQDDPNPYEPLEGQGTSMLGGQKVDGTGDPTDGGKHGEIGDAPSIVSDEPDDGSTFPVGGGAVTEEENAPPVADPGPDA
ncbi:hypothetical protein SAMN05660662_1799 [Blastococcus aurantiacus]|uniref:Uncharacterized protein n=1 Tax=Blastococcus aurantiacus TaxID=1550231 RepID=A0A1G7KCX6_9ACTN|nr:hypothetical protein [Blastococcus aurantiacus]SDF34986.1 hypothetical protein SAMN05660662_1799 [Blastococcus aurantiacus]